MAKPYLILLVALVSTGAVARTHAVRVPPRSVMWIGAHPDDEAVAAPLLASWCRERRARCALLVFTRGEAGLCLLPGGCLPDTASVRSAEAGAASHYFGADSIHLTFKDGGVDAASSAAVTTIARYIDAFRPEIILTFDPRHGTTCHPDHMAVSRIVLDAARLLTFDPDVYLLETRVTIDPDPLVLHFTPAIPDAERFDANAAWNAIIDDMKLHRSQFDDRWLAAVAAVPPAERAVYIASAAAALREEPAGDCPR